MDLKISPLFPHIHLDAVLQNDAQTSQFLASEAEALGVLGSVAALSSMSTSHNPVDTASMGSERFKVLHYHKAYTGTQRVGRFFQGLILTLCTLFGGLFDQRIRHNWEAAFNGFVEKHVAISERTELYRNLQAGSEFLQQHRIADRTSTPP